MFSRYKTFPITKRLILICVAAIMTFYGFAPASQVKANPAAAFSQISFVPNIETAGVVVSGADLPPTAQLLYRRSGDANWQTGHSLVKIKDGRLVGSLFGLAQSTSYEVRVIVGAAEILGSFTTQADELTFSPANIIYVNDDAPAGGDGSVAAPFRTIQEGVTRAAPGTQVLVADGLYHETVTFPASGTAGNWIQVNAEGSGAILDGSTSIAADSWKPYEGKSNVYYTKIGPGIKYLARDGMRFYQYDDLYGLLDARGHNNVSISEGWFYDPLNTRLYVRINREPHKYVWQLPRLNAAFMVDGRDWVWIEGFEMRFYGTEYGCGVCAKNASHVVIRRNKIHNLQNPVFVEWTGGEDRGNDTRIEYNEMYDSIYGEWPWNAVKGTSMESIAIVLRGHTGAIVRGNNIHHYFNGLYTSSSGALENAGVAFDVDVYRNTIHHIGDDALEPEGTCVNHRFRNNTIDSTLVGISLAPITMGPVWVMRSSFANFTGRSIKWDRNSDGWVFYYHNTSWTPLPNVIAMDVISPVHRSILRNNIFQGGGYSFLEQTVGATNHDWNYDNWNTSTSGPRFKWENVDYATMNQLCRATNLECNGHEGTPGLVNPGGGDFNLLATSPNIDRGALIPGINDAYFGSAPDIGAYESAYGAPPTATNTPPPVITPTSTAVPVPAPLVISILRADASPTTAASVRFTVTFSKEVSGVDVNDFVITKTGGLANYQINGVSGSGNTYTVTLNTGTGDGTLRLDLIDNDSILDFASTPLGGAGTGNGSFSIGEVYLVNKNAPFVTSSLRADPSPSAAASVRFTVTFSESVSGVDTSDFVLTAAGLSGAGVASVSGVDSVYTVSVNTGSGNGTLRLDLLDNDSIVDSAGGPLGGAGLGNANFSTGESYVIDRQTPVIQTAVYYSEGAHDGWILESKENSNKGGTTNANAITFRIGDNAQDHQYRAILHFATESLPDNAVVTQAILTVQLETVGGTNPFLTHRNIWVDIREGAFGSFGLLQIGALQTSDFQAPASLTGAGTILNNPVGGWYWVSLDAKSFQYINLVGATQLRLGFQYDDDEDMREDFLSFFSGNYSVQTARPQLSIKYYVPK